MPRTAEERAAINRANARKSTGPKTVEGKAASRRNAVKHGLRAEALALPNEDPAAVAARSDSWNDYYRPQSPAAQHLVNACVAATLLSDRCQKYHAAAVSRQVREAESAWDAEREDEVAAAVALLADEPARGARRLKRTGHGCRWLAERWELLIAALDERGWWTDPERDQAMEMQGLNGDCDSIQADPDAWLQVFYATACRPTISAAALDWLFHPDRLPDLYRDQYDRDALPPADLCRAALREVAASELALARAREAARREEFDDPDRAEAADRALILHDGPSARLFLRYHAEARTAFQRAYGSLVKTLERDAAGEPDAPAVSPNEPNAPPAEPTDTVSPNEANPAPPRDPIYEDGPIPAPGVDRDFDCILEMLTGRPRSPETAPAAAPTPAPQSLVG